MQVSCLGRAAPPLIRSPIHEQPIDKVKLVIPATSSSSHFQPLQGTRLDQISNLTPKMQICFKKTLNLTHFVHIPIATRTSLPQVLTSFSLIENHPVAAVIPKGAFTHPANLHLTLGSLSLPTPSHVEAALRILRSAIVRQGEQPFTIHIVGLGNSLISGMPAGHPRTMALYSRIEETTTSLQSFCQNVRSTVLDKGLLKLNSIQTLTLPFHVKVISTHRLARDPVGPNLVKEPKWPLKPRFDALGLHRKYEDFVLMKDIQLQQIHISEIGLKKVLYDNVIVAGYRNIATVPLPGVDTDGAAPLQTELEASIPVLSPN